MIHNNYSNFPENQKIVYNTVKIPNKWKKIKSNKYYKYFYIFFTIYALFGDDVRQFISNVKIDNFFYSIMLLTFLFFCFDIYLLIQSVDKYLFSLLFILDIVGTFSLLFDLGWIN